MKVTERSRESKIKHNCFFYDRDKKVCKACKKGTKCVGCKFFKPRNDQREIRLQAEFNGRFM